MMTVFSRVCYLQWYYLGRDIPVYYEYDIFYFQRPLFCPCIHNFKEVVSLLFREVVYQLVSIVNHFQPHSASCIVMLLVMPFSSPSDSFDSLCVNARIGVNEVKPIMTFL